MRIGVGSIQDIPRLVGARDGQIVDIQRAALAYLRRDGATPERAAQLAAAAFPPSLTQVLGSGPGVRQWLARLIDSPAAEACHDAASVRLRCPVDPPGYRDFMSFDEHVRNTYQPTGKPPPSVLYDIPAYYKGSTATLIGPQDEVCWPYYADAVDYELEYALVIGAAGLGLRPGDALTHVFGVTLLNDFSARDMQLTEMRSRLGPAKGKDFATALGPWVASLDEIDVHDLAMTAQVNGTPVAAGRSGDALWAPEELVAWASAAEPLRPGEIIGSGTVGGGSGLESGRKLGTGDVIELSIDGVGILRNQLGPRGAAGYRPEPKRPGPTAGAAARPGTEA